MTPEISIVIPAYNAAAYLSGSVSSVIQQTFTNWELIIVNDGSTDNTEEVAKGFLTDHRISLINQLNKGVSAARNTGIDAAKGKFIGFLDADDSILAENLQHKYHILSENNMLDFIYSDSIHCDDRLNEVFVQKGIEVEYLFKETLLWRKDVIPAFSSNIVGTAILFKEKIRFDENLSNCADRYMKIQLVINAVGAYLPEALVKYRNTPNSMSKKIALLEHDELYIANKISENREIIQSGLHKKAIANIYYTLAGSWFTDAKKPIKAIKYAIKAVFAYPPILISFSKKLYELIIKGH